MLGMLNLMNSNANTNLQKILDILTSKVAFIIYIGVVLFLVFFLIVRVMVNESNKKAEIISRQKTAEELTNQNVINNITKSLDSTKKEIQDSIDEVRFKVNQLNYQIDATNFSAPVISNPVESKEQSQESDEKEKEVKGAGNRFYMLSQIDKDMENYVAPKYKKGMTLQSICESFRNFASSKLKLYYDIEDIRRFIGGLSVTKMIILQGMSGTGKTSLAYAFGEYLDNTTVVVPIQPMWKERTDLIGYYNEFTKKFNETTLLYKMYEANYNDEIYITVLDEMNIARVEYYFAEFLSLLELPNPEGRNLDVVSDKWDTDPKLLKKGKIRLPINMWFIGTINNDDSTFAISDKVYDRAMVLNLNTKARPFEAPNTESHKISAEQLQGLFTKAQKEYSISDRNLRRIQALDKYMIEHFKLTFGNRIMKQIKSYVPVIVACGGTELQALDDIMSTKVFRKLEAKNPVYVRQMADSMCAYLDELFGIDKMPLCKEAIRVIEQNI